MYWVQMVQQRDDVIAVELLFDSELEENNGLQQILMNLHADLF
jgi:hypothetical protein